MAVPRFEPCISLPLEPSVLEDVVPKAKDWALMHGAAMRSKTNFNPDSLQFAPFVLIPSVFPRKEFEKAVAIQEVLNELVHKVAHDRDFLVENLKSVIEVDEFTNKLFKIYETVYSEGITQPIALGLLRSDIMLETCCGGGDCNEKNKKPKFQPHCCWKQVEVNTIASGFGWLGPASALIHSYVLAELGAGEKLKNLPPNSALEGLCGGMLEAWKLYGQEKAVILFIVEDVTYNICDQRFHEFKIREMAPKVKVIRKTLTEMSAQAKLGQHKELLVNGMEIAVVYFRSGYEPSQYNSSDDWDARLLIERSQAIKCPTIYYHLAGTKKVQQALAHPGALERFLNDADKVESVRDIFTGLYALEFSGEKAVEMAMSNPDNYVLKPQREGGGNNVYGQQVKEVLEGMRNSQERTAWILMERIKPPVQKSYMIRPGTANSEGQKLVPVDVVSELGIFGAVIGDANKIISNKQVGHMLRTKISTADEGGVAAGLGALDSPYLID
ncbi:Glutathione synthetase [Gryllus bimaculatus]|nr:Glutathione synthetase [Gryllus bimaculatus]